jgi:SAM-dependent methyltransferase
MKISLKKIRELNNEIGLGTYGFLSSLRYQIALQYISKLCVNQKKICEIGPGGVIFYIAKYSEASAFSIVSPREHHWDNIFETYNISSFEWDLNKTLNNDELIGSFDCIIFLETLEHLNRWPEQVLDDIHKLLKQDGVLLLSTPNLVRFSNRVRMFFGKRPNNPFKYSEAGEHHVREYTLSELEEFMPSNNWEILDTSYELPHSFANTRLFKFFLSIFKTLIGTIIFVKAKKK